MSGQTVDQKIDDNAPPKPYRGGRIILLVLIVLGVILAVVIGRKNGFDIAEKAQWFSLLALAIVGVCTLFAWAVYLLRFGHAPDAGLADFLIDQSDDALLIINARGKVIFSNAAYLEFVGAPPGTSVPTLESKFANLPFTSDAMYRLALSAKEGHSWAEDIKFDAGFDEETPRWFRIDVQCLDAPVRREKLILWRVRNISRDKQKQENAFHDIQRAIENLDYAPVGFFAVEQGYTRFINVKLSQWLGLDQVKTRDRPPSLKDLISGQGYALLTALRGEPNGEISRVLDLDLVKQDGVGLPVRLIHQQHFDEAGEPDTSRTVVINLAEQVGPGDKSDLTMDEQFSRLLNQIPLPIATVHTDGSLGRQNGAFAKLFRSTGPQKLLDLCKEGDHPALTEKLAEMLAKRARIEPADVELNDEGVHHARLHFVGIDNLDDGDVGILYVVETTEQKSLERQFAQSQKMQAVGQLAGGIAHDFNNVLTAIIGFSDLLLETHKATDPSFQDIMNIKQNANRAAGLVRQLLAFSRRQTMRPKIVHVEEVLGDLSSLMRRLIGEGVTLTLDLAPNLWLLKADVSQLDQVIVNLAVNARDAMPEGGDLTVRARNCDQREAMDLEHYEGLVAADYVLIEVQDTGTGMPPEVKAKVFEPFFSTKEIGKGTGLGLSTVYGIIKQSEGFIYIDTEEGKGTCFRIFLPRHIPEENAEEATEKAAPVVRRNLTGSETILLVEDEDAVRTISERALTARGYRVLVAESGADALEIVEDFDEPIDLIISDVVMPEVDGPEMVRQLKTTMNNLRVIFISGYAEEAVRNDIGQDESVYFLPKPFTLKQLVSTVKDVFEKS